MINIAPILMGCAKDAAGQSKKRMLNAKAQNANANFRDAMSTSSVKMGGIACAG